MKGKKWIKFRHRIGWWLINTIARPVVKHKYHLKYTKFKESKKRQFLVLINHQTPLDQFFFSLMFYGKKYLVVTEDVMRNGAISSILRYLTNPIPFKKSTNDISAVRTCLKVAKEGGTIFLAPEGNRTYSGKTGYIKPSVAKLCKAIKLPVAILKIENGYSVQPRWSDVVRKGKCKAYVSEVLEQDFLQSKSDEELATILQEKLYQDESGDTGIFKSKKKAEYLERAMFVCPDCKLSTFVSNGNKIKCLKCGKEIEYKDNKLLSGINFDFPFKTVGEWYDYQHNYINNLDTSIYNDTPVYTETVRLSRIFEGKARILINAFAELSLYGNKFIVKSNLKDRIFDFDDISGVTVLGRNKLDFYYKDETFQIKGGKRFNALKYMFFYYRFKNIKEKNNDTFLGL